MIRKFLNIPVLLFSPYFVCAQLSGPLSGTLPGDSTYTVVGDIFVESGDSLIIESGAVLIFGPDLAFAIYGFLRAEGSEIDSIKFIGSPDRNWRGIFFYQTADDSSKLKYCLITGVFGDNGGGIYLENTSLTLTNCAIANNRVNSAGGGLYCSYANLNIDNCHISQNRSLNGGGGIFCEGSILTISNSIIERNQTDEFGGGIYSIESSVIMNGCSLYSNISLCLYYAGGGIYSSYSSLNIDSCSFNENSGYNGGGIYCGDSSNLNIEGCNFVQNQSVYGGGIHCRESSSVHINDCLFLDNGPVYEGGGMYFHTCDPIITNCLVENNRATDAGGGIYGYNTGVNITDCVFSGNLAQLQAAGINLTSCSNPVITNCVITGNNPIGISCGITTLYLSNCIINENIGSGLEGGSFNLYADSCEIFDNYGSGINLNTAGGSISHSLIYDNSISSIDSGGIILYNSSFTIANCEIFGNSGGGLIAPYSYVQITDCEIYENDGSGCYFENNFGSSITNCNIHHNSATNGGGIYGDFANPVLTGCSIQENTAILNGGGIYLRNSFFSSLSNCIITCNTASGAESGGGGIYLNNSRTTFNRCQIYANVASNKGGGFICENWSSPEFVNCDINSNSAVLGAGLYCYDSTPTLLNTIVWGNTEGGGANFANYSSPFISYCDFFNNLPDNLTGQPANVGLILFTNANGDSCDIFHNIFLDPQFVNPQEYNYNLSAGSPCIDAGDPQVPLDPDSTIADIGVFYFDQTSYVGTNPLNLPPSIFNLMPPYPNPFNCQTILCFEVPKAEYISLIVYDIMGREICVLEEDFLLSGTYQVIFDASKFASGIYFAQLQAGDFMQTQKMVLMK